VSYLGFNRVKALRGEACDLGYRSFAPAPLARGILDATGEPHYNKTLSELLKHIGADSPWVQHFKRLVSTGATSDKQGDLAERTLKRARSFQTLDTKDDKAIAKTLVCAVATRNLVSHRHKLLSREQIMYLGGVCANSVVLVWLLSKARGLV